MSEKLISELNETWEEKLRKTEAIRLERYDFRSSRDFLRKIQKMHFPQKMVMSVCFDNVKYLKSLNEISNQNVSLRKI
jgi:hypothetical protein